MIRHLFLFWHSEPDSNLGSFFCSVFSWRIKHPNFCLARDKRHQNCHCQVFSKAGSYLIRRSSCRLHLQFHPRLGLKAHQVKQPFLMPSLFGYQKKPRNIGCLSRQLHQCFSIPRSYLSHSLQCYQFLVPNSSYSLTTLKEM